MWLLSVGLLAGCTTATADPPPPTTSTTVPVRRPTVADPLRVIVAGDSLAGEVKLPLEHALEGSGRVELDWELVPAIPRRPRAVASWRRLVQREDPEVVVVLVGYWETYAPVHRLAGFVDDTTAGGAELVWIGSPLPRDPGRAAAFAALNEEIRSLADADDRVRFVDGHARVAGADGGFLAADGDVRLRWPDGLHLCPDGALRVAEPALQWIADRWDVPVTRGWRTGGWRHAVFSGDRECGLV